SMIPLTSSVRDGVTNQSAGPPMRKVVCLSIGSFTATASAPAIAHNSLYKSILILRFFSMPLPRQPFFCSHIIIQHCPKVKADAANLANSSQSVYNEAVSLNFCAALRRTVLLKGVKKIQWTLVTPFNYSY